MKKKTGLKSKETRVLLSHGFFNKRYIVRNTLAATVLVTFLVIAVGVSSVITGDAMAGEDELTQAEDKRIEDIVVEEVKATTESEKEPVQVVEVSEDKKAEPHEDETGVSAVDTTPVTTSKYDNRFIAIDTGVNIRSGADTDYDVIGYLETGMVGDFLGYEGEWSYIAVGDLYGYVNSQYILTGDLAAEFADKNNYDIDAFSYYEAVEEDVYSEDEEYEGADSYYADDDALDAGEAYEDLEDSDIEQGDSDTEEAYEESDDTEETEEAYEEEDSEDDGDTAIETINRDSIAFTEEDITLIAAVVALEAGNECYEGQLAVANVVINRLNSGYWGNTIEGVVYAQNQFEVVNTSAFAAYIANGASGLSLQAALEAAGGTNNIGDYMSFRPTYFLNSMSFDNYTIIGNHIFF